LLTEQALFDIIFCAVTWARSDWARTEPCQL